MTTSSEHDVPRRTRWLEALHSPLGVALIGGAFTLAATVLGVWLSRPAPAPTTTVPSGSDATAPAYACPERTPCIKANVSSTGRLYHLPGCSSYKRVTIDPSHGEALFASSAEAEAAGFRRARNCP